MLSNRPTASILVVDDELLSRLVLVTHLTEDGYTVTEASSGTEALALLRAQTFDAVLLDMLMPDLDGYEVLEKIKLNPKLNHLPVIIISALSEMESIAKCIERGATDYVIKPFSPRLLNARLKACLMDKWLRDVEQDLFYRFQVEHKKVEELLLNILPRSIAQRLQNTPGVIADNFPDVTVLFADIVGFTEFAATLPPAQVVDILNLVFSRFDDLADHYALEKIKTIGDAYMVVGGLPMTRPDHAQAIAEMALAMQAAMHELNARAAFGAHPLQLRIGAHCGPVTAGVIGRRKFSYDLWGDTVNIASRMQTQGPNGEIQVSAALFERLHSSYDMRQQGEIEVRGRGNMLTYLLKGSASVLLGV